MSRRLWPYIVVLLLLSACRSTKESGRSVPTPAAVHEAKTALATQAAPSDEQRRRFDMLFLEALRQKQASHIDAEYELLDEALTLCPDASEAVYEMALLKLSYTPYSDTASRTEGDSLLRRAVALAPDNLYYKETLATHLANNANYREAINIYEDLSDGHLTDETLAALVWLYKSSADYAGAIRTLERLERLNGRSENVSMEKFQTYIAMNDNEHAYQAIEDLCAEYPYDLRYRVLLGDLYDQQGYHDRAYDIYRDVLTAEPDNSYAQLSLLAYYKAAQSDSLYTALLERVVLNPHTQSGARLEALRAYATDNLQSGADPTPVLALFRRVLAEPQDERDIAELRLSYMSQLGLPADTLINALDELLEIEPDYTKARLMRLQFSLMGEDHKEVVRICREGELYDPTEVTFYYYEGGALYRLGHDMEAIRRLQAGTERIDDETDGQLASALYALLGDVLYDKNLKEEAFLAYDRALELNASNVLCLNNYAYFLTVEGKALAKAERMARRAIEAEGDNPTYLDTYAWVLYMQHDYETARIYVEEALSLSADNADAAELHDHAGDIYFRLGQRTEALEHWKRALNLTNDKALRKSLQRKVWRKRI